MSYLYATRYQCPEDELILSLRQVSFFDLVAYRLLILIL